MVHVRVITHIWRGKAKLHSFVTVTLTQWWVASFTPGDRMTNIIKQEAKWPQRWSGHSGKEQISWSFWTSNPRSSTQPVAWSLYWLSYPTEIVLCIKQSCLPVGVVLYAKIDARENNSSNKNMYCWCTLKQKHAIHYRCTNNAQHSLNDTVREWIVMAELLTFSQQSCWRFKTSGMWRCAFGESFGLFQRAVGPSSSWLNNLLYPELGFTGWLKWADPLGMQVLLFYE
jgi:hypothetical protein